MCSTGCYTEVTHLCAVQVVVQRSCTYVGVYLCASQSVLCIFSDPLNLN